MQKKSPFFLIIFLLVVFFLPMFFNRFILDGDLADEYMPKMFLIGESIRSFTFPVTENGMGLGFPIYKDIQSGIFYPLNWIFGLPVDFLILIQISVFLNALIFGFSLFFLARLLYPEGKNNLVLAALSLFSGFFISHIPHYTMLCSLSVAPLFLYFYISFLRKRSKNLFLAGVFFGVLLILAGHPQIFFLVFILSFCLSVKERSGWASMVNPMMIFVFIFFISLFALAPTMSLAGYSFRSDASMKYNIIPLKYLILLVFPNLFGGSSIISGKDYQGFLNINEVQFYSSMLFLFAFAYAVKRIFFDRDYKYSNKLIIPLVFFLLSLFTEFNLHVFLTPGRALGFSVIAFLFSVLPDSIEKYDRRTLIIYSVIFLASAVLAFIRGFSPADILIPAVFFIFYLLFFIFIKKRSNHFEIILVFLVFADLVVSAGGIINYSERKNIENTKHEELKGKHIVTYLPEETAFYFDEIKAHFKTDNLEELKRYSSCGNRGVYYKAYSFNLYQNFTFSKYVEFFSDRSIMTGGFSNINFIMNPLVYNYDYVFIPDMPAFFNVMGTLLIPYREDMKDTFCVYYTGELENVITAPVPENDYLKNIDSLKSGILMISGPTMLKGDAKILMLKKYMSEETVRLPEMFEKMNFETADKGAFYLFKNNSRDEKELDFITSPVDGSFIRERKADYMPMDLLLGMFMSVIAAMTMFSYLRKEYK